ncbi:hypothetical protein [Mycobacterium sp. 1274756.6]|uniref:hypothetical protein n=1 Tax=Mycobacterium sp. 1274756.6 TaxID=1834076 RepID=UPI000800AF4A|nr:hypothetical protein [Mycobacterium sp. 1274756.6]OBJ72513.1 hypothetical protein A5643_05300 [Mycobacterium sp. 1274756.6]
MSVGRVRRWLLAALVAVVAVAGSPPAFADPKPFETDPRYSPQLNSRIVKYNTALAELSMKIDDLKARTDDLSRRVREHNNEVDSYPGHVAPPAVADRINAAGAALRAEQGQLNAELDALKAEADRLEGEQTAIAAAAAAEINAIIQTDPPPHTAPQPGNQYQRRPGTPPPVQPQARDGGNPTQK